MADNGCPTFVTKGIDRSETRVFVTWGMSGPVCQNMKGFDVLTAGCEYRVGQ